MRILEDSPAVRVLEDRGIRKGIQQGVQQGIQQTALNMLQEGDDFSKVARVTGLDIERVMELNDELLGQKSGV